MEKPPSHGLSFEAAATMLPERWLPESKLGSGGMSVVLKVRDGRTGRPAAVKILCVIDRKAESGKRRFERELSTCLSLEHPNVIRILDGECSDESCYIVMELLDGYSTLRSLLGTRPFEDEEIVHLVAQTASALAYLHDRGVIHRDVKPGNLMVDHRLHVKLMDLGLVKLMGKKSFTKHGTLVGTPRYLAPEIVQGGEATPAVDLYALGLVAYELYTGRRAFPQNKLMELLKAIVRSDCPDPHRIAPRRSPALGEIIVRAMSSAPALRYATARSMLRDLAQLDRDGKLSLKPETRAILSFGTRA